MELKKIEIEVSEEDVVQMIKEVVWRKYLLDTTDLDCGKLQVEKKDNRYIVFALL